MFSDSHYQLHYSNDTLSVSEVLYLSGSELKKLMDGHYTKLAALDDLPGILINDESDDFLSEVDDPSESTSDSQLDCAPSDPVTKPSQGSICSVVALELYT